MTHPLLSNVLPKSEKTLLYFYPKDNTPGCTLEAQDFTRLKSEFLALGIQIIGVSKDNPSSHEKFMTSCNLAIELISDEDLSLHHAFSVIGEKNMYGKKTI
jgi:peroxiredoxin Q/BCP